MSGDIAMLVLGPSSVGKSTYIDHLRLADDRWRKARTVLGWEIAGLDVDYSTGPSTIYHYNMLHPFGNDPDRVDVIPVLGCDVDRIFMKHPRLEARLLVATRATLMKRVLLRDVIERSYIPEPYDSLTFFAIYTRLALTKLYDAWVAYLENKGIHITFVSTDHDRYELVTREEAFVMLGSDAKANYNQIERSRALLKVSSSYQSLEGIGLRLGSDGTNDRSATLKTIVPHLSAGSVLDVGCGQGYFCFALEKLGYFPVLGIESKSDRYVTARAIGQIIGSDCAFAHGDVSEIPLAEQFDNVLLLNVLHHLVDPIANLRRLATICRSTLIIEFATPSDPKFRCTVPGDTVVDLTELPVIGVSLLDKQDQTFLFSASALHRILTNHSAAFQTVSFHPSNAGRLLAVCRKKPGFRP